MERLIPVLRWEATCDRGIAKTTAQRNILVQDVFEEMDFQLGLWLQSDTTVVGPLKCFAGWGGDEVLRRGLGGRDSCRGLPQRNAWQAPTGPDLAPDISQRGRSCGAASDPVRGPAGSSLARLLQTVQNLHDEGNVSILPRRPGVLENRAAVPHSRGWRPRVEWTNARTDSAALSRAPAGDEALAIQLQFGPRDRASAETRQEEASHAAGVARPSQLASIDEALALALCFADGLEDEDLRPVEDRNHRAEARRRVQARRFREGSREGSQASTWGGTGSLPPTEPEAGADSSPDDSDGFYTRLWGLDGHAGSLSREQRGRRRHFEPKPEHLV